MLCILTPENFYLNEYIILEEIFNENKGVYFHIRKSKLNEAEMKTYLDNFSEAIKKRFVLHTNHSLINVFSLLGAHYKEKDWKDKKTEHANSIAIHNLEDLNISIRLKYMFLSPVFNSISKKNYNAKFSNIQLKESLKLTKHKVIALGGINKENIKEVKSLGFSGIAVLGAIWNSGDPVNSFKEINKEWKEHYS